MLHYTALHCIALHYITLHYITKSKVKTGKGGIGEDRRRGGNVAYQNSKKLLTKTGKGKEKEKNKMKKKAKKGKKNMTCPVLNPQPILFNSRWCPTET